MRRFLVPRLLLGLGLSAAFASPAGAAELAGVELADSVEAGDETLVLNGLGLRRKIGFKVYVGGLYLTAKSSDANSILAADKPRRTDMVFLRKVSSKQLCEAWKGTIAGEGFADVLFACWIGDKPATEDLKRGMLGQ